MSISSYKISVLDYEKCKLKMSASLLKEYLQAWRNNHITSSKCIVCNRLLPFENNFLICCNNFYFKPTNLYLVQSIAVKTPNYAFLPKGLSKKISDIKSQEFLIIPDPNYWLMSATLTFDRVLNYVQNLPVSKRKIIQKKPPKFYYDQIQHQFLNHGSLAQRSEGKNTYYRRIAIAKRAEFTLRAMIIPAPFLKPNEIIIPFKIEKEIHLKGKWLIINRMPSLIPENFFGLYVVGHWSNDCFGIPLEIVQQMNADFDGDEINCYVTLNVQGQAECATILNSQYNIASFTSELKLAPCHDMIVTYYLKYNEIDFLPYKHPSLTKTFRVLYDLYGSEETFKCIDEMRKYYLDVTQNEFIYALTLREFLRLEEIAQRNLNFEDFVQTIQNDPTLNGCLMTQIKSGAKGTFYHLFQLVGSVGYQSDSNNVKSSFLRGLTPTELVAHAQTGFEAFINASAVWIPGYNFFKLCNNLQDLIVDYKGRLVDKTTVMSEDVLQMMHHEDLLSKQSFKVLIDKYLKREC